MKFPGSPFIVFPSCGGVCISFPSSASNFFLSTFTLSVYNNSRFRNDRYRNPNSYPSKAEIDLSAQLPVQKTVRFWKTAATVIMHFGFSRYLLVFVGSRS